jgi:hypothetical protein
MKKKIQPIAGNLYYLKDHTSPKVFTGKFFECALTDQRTEKNHPIHSDLGSLKDWSYEIWRPERFDALKEILGFKSSILDRPLPELK